MFVLKKFFKFNSCRLRYLSELDASRMQSSLALPTLDEQSIELLWLIQIRPRKLRGSR